MLYNPDPSDGSGPATRRGILDMIGQHSQIIPVANVTARTQLITRLTEEGKAPSPSNPVFVHRADADPGLELERTTDGTNWGSALMRRSAYIGTRTTNLAVPSTATGDGTAVSLAQQVGVGGVSSSGSLITIAESGLYQVSYCVPITGDPNGVRIIRVKVNGTFGQGLTVTKNGTSVLDVSTCSTLLSVSGRTTLELFVRQNSGSTLSVTPDYMAFTIARVA